MMNSNDEIQFGYLASRTGVFLPVQILGSTDGFYIGTWQNGPLTRESNEYFPNLEAAQNALNSNQWTQYQHP